jgi:uncharacterized membrane protein SpoIIM required for sporulation
MTWIIVAGVAGLFIGWNVPQPQFAKNAQAWVMKKLGRGT